MSIDLSSKIKGIIDSKDKEFIAKKNVVGVALGTKISGGVVTNDLCLSVLVEKKEEKSQLKESDLIPSKYQGCITDVVETGKLEAHLFNTRQRPGIGGYSVGVDNNMSAGTAACLVSRGTGLNMQYFILSNNHVLALTNQARVGTSILQPAYLDGGSSQLDKIATLTQYIPISFWVQPTFLYNDVDAAIAQVVNPSIMSPELAWSGYIKGIRTAQTNMQVKKAGRTTQMTTGTVTMTGATVLVTYDDNKQAAFKNQIVTTVMSMPGDSGSLLLDRENYAIGLLFAGSSTATIYNPIQTVLNKLNVQLVTL